MEYLPNAFCICKTAFISDSARSLISSAVGSFFLEAERARIRKGNSGTIPLKYKYLSMVG
jgi:hypothetical protein